MLKIAIILSTVELFTEIFSNARYEIQSLIPLEFVLLTMNLFLFVLLRKNKASLKLVSLVVTR